VAGNNWVIDDDTMATASPQTVPSSESIKSYVDSLTGTATDLTDHMVFRGDYDATTNTPDLDGSAPREPVVSGDTYIISADGLFWTEEVTTGTLLIANQDDPNGLNGWEIVAGASELSALSDVTTAAVTDKFALMADGASYVGRALVEADISDLGTYSTASSTETLTNKTFDANGTGNSLSNVDVADLSATGTPSVTTYLRGDNTWATVAVGTPDDTAYGASWNGDTTTAPSKNAVYDKIETLGSGGGQVDSVVGGTNITVDNTDPINPIINASGGGGGGTVQGSSVTYDILLASADGSSPVGTADKSVDLQASRTASTQTSKGISSVISGGSNNTTEEPSSVIAGGSNNNNKSFAATISGGEYNQITGLSTQAAYSVITGGRYNFVKNSSPSSTVSGEYNEIDSSSHSSISGGKSNRVTNSLESTVIGGFENKINPTGSGTNRSAIVGGNQNQIQSSLSFIGGGNTNTISAYSTYSSIVGGSGNSMSGYYGSSSCVIAGGSSNNIEATNAFIGGGNSNTISGGFMGGGSGCSIVGGSSHSIYYSNNSVILGGISNAATQSDYSVLSGRRAKIPSGFDGVFIYADNTNSDFTADVASSAQFRVANGMHISSSLFLTQQSAALADISTKGQIWVRNANDKDLMYTDASGNDMTISAPVGTFADLPNSPLTGARAFVTDSLNALANHHGTVVAGGGTNFVPVFRNNANSWIIG